MKAFLDTLQNAVNYIKTIGVADAFDILVVAILIYWLLRLLEKTNVIRVARGIIVLLLVLWLSGILRLTMVNFILRRAVELGLLALVVLFQPELRRGLEKVGSRFRLSGLLGNEFQPAHIERVITQVVLACGDMSESRTGALIIFTRDNQLSDPVSTGTLVDASVTAELLKNLIFKNSPLHDGAVIIRDGRIAAAGCMLPMSGNKHLSKDLGMRHRAGIGISEQSDAVVVIVSEETGAISVAEDGMLKRHLSPQTMETLLRKELIPDETDTIRRRTPLDLIRGRRNG